MHTIETLTQNINKMAKSVELLSATIEKQGQQTMVPQNIAEAAIVKRALDVQQLQTKLSILNHKLESLWLGDQLPDLKGRESRLLAQIDQVEVALESINGLEKSGDHEFLEGRHSVFRRNGGQSIFASVPDFNDETLFGVARKSDKVRKAEEDIDLIGLVI